MWKRFNFNRDFVQFSCHIDRQFNEFDILVRSEWDRAVAEGLFTFEIQSGSRRRTLDGGDLQYIIELNPSRFEKRRKPFPFDNVRIPFDKTKFNFNKINDSEVLFSLCDQQQCDKYLIIINNSPINPYHVLLVPERELEQPQILTVDGISFGLKFIASSYDPHIFVGFNSLCAYASINHLHLHGMYIPHRLYTQTIKCSPFHSKSNCYLLDQFETEAFAFELQHIDQLNMIAENVYKITNYLSLNNIAHNVIFVKGDSFSSANVPVIRTFIWFRESVLNGKMFQRCNFASVELAGFMPLQHQAIYDELTEVELREHLNAIALPLERKKQIKDDIKIILG